MKTRIQIADELINGCPDEMREDHEHIASLIRSGASKAEIESDKILNEWPDTYFWLMNEFEDNQIE